MEARLRAPAAPSAAREASIAEASLTEPLRVVFVLRSLLALKSFRPALELLVDRGHRVCLLLESARDDLPVEQAWLQRMLGHANFTAEHTPGFRYERWQKRGITLRAAIEYVFSLTCPDRPRYLTKASHAVPGRVSRLADLPLVRSRLGLRLLHASLCAVERALPGSEGLPEYLDRLAPDVLALGDFGSRGSLHTSLIRAAKRAGIPVASCIAGWDNLSTRPRMTAIPHRVVVWNEIQRREAAELHGVPAEKVAVTGAPAFDQWFHWQPRSREEFLARVGLDPAKHVVLWVGGALLPWEQPEPLLVERWLAALRASDDPRLRNVGVLIRPHPYRIEQWQQADLSAFDNVTIWPREQMSMPIDHEQQADYYDSIFHASAVVGVNTSAMIEAAIVGRPVLSVLDPDHHDSQLGSVHYSYLLEGGAVQAAESLEEHLAQLAAILAGGEQQRLEAARRFVADFVRPHGLERPATPYVVEAIEQLAATPLAPERDPRWLRGLRGLILLVTLPETLRARRRGKSLRKRLRKLGKRARRRLLSVPRAARVRLR
jgi:hypothetical protein